MLGAQSNLTPCDLMDCNPPGSSVCGILQARILEWVAIPFSRDLPNPGIKSGSPELQADSLPVEPPGMPFGLMGVTLKHCFIPSGRVVIYIRVSFHFNVHADFPGDLG